jgi:hypothetical protein
MTPTELDTCLRLLEAYWPGEWDEARCLVWAQAFGDGTATAVRDAIVSLGRTAKFPTVAEFLELLGNGVRVRDGEMFMPGTGWVKMLTASTERPEMGEAAVVQLAAARKRLRRDEAS